MPAGGFVGKQAGVRYTPGTPKEAGVAGGGGGEVGEGSTHQAPDKGVVDAVRDTSLLKPFEHRLESLQHQGKHQQQNPR